MTRAADPDNIDGCMPVTRSFFRSDTETVARALLGMILTRCEPDGTLLAGRIVEAEAYLPVGDPAAHGARGRTPATEALFGIGGTLYVHPMRRHCGLDIVTGGTGWCGSVLLRALEPRIGIGRMRARRGTDDDRLIASGPARLTMALGIARDLSGADLLDSRCPLKLLAPLTPVDSRSIERTPRIGLSKGRDLQLRFTLAGSRFLSRTR